MRHRVEAAGGRLTIQSTVGEGTTVSAIIPTAAQHSDNQPSTQDKAVQPS